jgi:hypothetical protein
VLRRLDEVERHLEEAAFLLTPHLWAPSDNPRQVELHEISVLAHGVFNLGFYAHRADAEARRVLDFWRERTYRYCHRDHARGLVTDQKWANLFPVFFDGVRVLRERTLNVSSWNIANIDFAGDAPMWYADGAPIGFLHFSGSGGDTFRWAVGEVDRLSPSVLSAVDWYRGEVAAQSKPGLPRSRDFVAYASGARIERFHRHWFRAGPRNAARFPNPYDDADPDGFFRSELEPNLERAREAMGPPGMIRRVYD